MNSDSPHPESTPDAAPSDAGNDANADSDRATDESAYCPPFHPHAMERQLHWDAAARWFLVMLVMVLLLSSIMVNETGGTFVPATVNIVFTMLVVVAWIWMGTISRRAAERLMRATAVLEQDPSAAETYIAEGLRRRPIGRSIRLLLYHRLAVLRHREGNFFEAGIIAQTLLRQRLRTVEHVRTHLLLLLAESQMRCGNPQTAHDAMQQLHKRDLQLVESLQLLALQTQYEVSLGYHADALNNLDEKIRLSRIMPGPQSGALHAMLAAAAKHLQRNELADWLDRRAKLLCSDKQLEELTLPSFNAASTTPVPVV